MATPRIPAGGMPGVGVQVTDVASLVTTIRRLYPAHLAEPVVARIMTGNVPGDQLVALLRQIGQPPAAPATPATPAAAAAAAATPIAAAPTTATSTRAERPYTYTPRPTRSTPAAASVSQSMRRTRASSPVHQAPAQPVGPAPLGGSADPLPPYTRVGRGQALHSTYASRLRAGTTTLMQPVGAQGAAAGAGAAQEGGRGAGGGVGRTRARVNYAEQQQSDVDDNDSDESDAPATLRRRTSSRAAAAAAGTATPTGQSAAARVEGYVAMAQTGGSYLGRPAPGNLVFPKRIDKSHNRHPYNPDKDLSNAADAPYLPIPIRIELDTETFRLRDSFIWNANERLLKPLAFAQTFCADCDLPEKPYAQQIADAITAQVEEHMTVAEVGAGRAALAHASRKRRREEAEEEGRSPVGSPAPTPVEDGKEDDKDEDEKEQDLRVIVNLDVQISTLHLLDKLEWDLTSPLPPELFSSALCADLGLSGEAHPLIAHALHEELIRHKKDAIELGLIGGAAGAAGAPGMGVGPRRLEGVWRDWQDAEEFVPRLEVLSAEEIERREMDKERASRRMRRETARSSTRRRR